MRLAVIAPPQELKLLQLLNQDYHLALGQELLRSSRYMEWHAQRAADGHFIIVDNGAAEHDTPPFSEIVSAANWIAADEIAMPDVLKEGLATAIQTCSPIFLEMVEPNRRMVIPQGKTWGEWTACLRSIATDIQFATIGVPKHLESLPGGRVHALEIITQMGLDVGHNVHLLGCYELPIKEAHEARERFGDRIRGLDTGAPIAWAQHDALLTRTPKHFSLQWERFVAEPEIVVQNILALREVCYGLRGYA